MDNLNQSLDNYEITSAFITRRGNRNYNEDSVISIATLNRCLYGVADGLGGQGFGRVASETAVGSVKRIFEDESIDMEDFLPLAFNRVQEDLMSKKAMGDYGDMMTTLALVHIAGNIRWAHIGDTRVYLFADGRICDYTLDHSVPQALVYADEITPDEIRHHPDRNRLLRAVGKEWNKDEFSVSDAYEIRSGEALLICSDGFWEYVLESEMEEALLSSSTPEEWLNAMEKIILKRGHDYDMDNYSAVAVMIK